MIYWGMARMGRPKAALVLTDEERAELMRLTKRTRVNRGVAFRARLVLACADHPLNTVVARRGGSAPTLVNPPQRPGLAPRRRSPLKPFGYLPDWRPMVASTTSPAFTGAS